MTLRFSLNNLTQNTSDVGQVLWYVYSFMTKTSPNGPGWVSVGESNGTTGGIGTTGLITSITSMSSLNSWFVLRSPDSKMQILFAKSLSTLHYTSQAVLSVTGFTGGTASTLPTYTAASSLIYTAAATLSSTVYYYNINIMADDAFPYGFYYTVMNVNCAATASPPTSYDSMFLIPLDGYDALDGYPYIFCKTNANTSNLDVTTDTTNGAKAFNYNITSKGVTPPLRLYNYTTNVGPNLLGPSSSINYVFGTPLIFSSSAIYKGISYKYGWKSKTFMRTGKLFNNRNFMCFGDMVIPWDGYTIPVINYNG